MRAQDELGPEIPWHLSRFTPAYQTADVPSMPTATLLKARAFGREAGLRYVYVGNVTGEANPACRTCGYLLIRRPDYQAVANDVAPGGRCLECGTPVGGRGMAGAAAG